MYRYIIYRYEIYKYNVDINRIMKKLIKLPNTVNVYLRFYLTNEIFKSIYFI